MATPPLSDELAQEAWDAYIAHGRSDTLAAQSLGIPRKTFANRRARAVERGMSLDPAIKDSMAAVGTNMVPALAWAKTKSDDGTSYSVLLKPQPDDPIDLAERMLDRLNNVCAIPAIARPQYTDSDLLNFVPVYDVHMGMRIGSYGTMDAVARLMDGFCDVLDRSPRAETVIILNGGDFTEANDNDALTPSHRHPLAVDKDFDEVADIAVDTTVQLIEYALKRSAKVVYKALRANHDPHMSKIFRQGLRQRYRENPRFELHDGFGRFSYEWGGNFIAGIHGDEVVSNPKDLALAIAADHSAAWGRTKWRELWRGHRHKELSIGLAGIRVNQVNPICPAGRYAKGNLFSGQSEIQCVTYKKEGGRRATAVHLYDDWAE